MKPQIHIPKMWAGNENTAAQDVNSIGCSQSVFMYMSLIQQEQNTGIEKNEMNTKRKGCLEKIGVEDLMKHQETRSFYSVVG